MKEKIKVLDALPGTGKSTAIFKWMVRNKEEKFLYVSPLLSEVTERVQTEVPELSFKTPEGISKSKGVLKLLEDGENISCTHALFLMMNQPHWDAIKDQGYIVILDEEIAVIERFEQGNKGDLPLLIDLGQCSIEGPYSKVMFNGDYDKYLSSGLKEVAEAAHKGILYTSSNDNQRDFLVTQVPVDLILAAKSLIVLTYMFEGSILERFLALHGIGWKPFYLPLHKTNEEVIQAIRQNITLKSTRAIDALSRFNLTATWYDRATRAQLNMVGDAWRSVSRNVPDSRLLTTLPKTNKDRNARGIGNAKTRAVSNSWLWAGTRATNEHADKDVVVHLYNRNPSENVKAYFYSHGFPIDSDHFKLSELIQFVFRSAIRKGMKIDLYIASPTMKKLFLDWLNDAENQVLEKLVA